MTNRSGENDEYPVKVQVASVVVDGNLRVPKDAKGIVLFAHGSGSSRFSPRNRYVAEVLNDAGLATLLMDLLTREEEEIDLQTRQFRFDIEMLADRLIGATAWIKNDTRTKNLPVGFFGSSTGAGAALIAAARLVKDVDAVVSRGGRPDLAMRYLSDVKAPVLLIVGGNDRAVIEMNKEAMEYLTTEKRLEIVPGATHLFEEPGTLEQVAKLASEWFSNHLVAKHSQ